MPDIGALATAAVSGGGITLLGQWATAWWTGRGERDRTDKTLDAQLEEHRDNLTFDLLKAAREEMAQLRTEATSLRPLMAHAAHLEEALDHLHALLHAEGDAERRAAVRRAKAFLRRMRPGIGDLRNQAQAQASAKNLITDIGGEP